MHSLRVGLLKWLILPLLAANLLGAGLTWWLAWTPAQIAFDQSLADATWALIPRLRVAGGHVEVDLSNQAEQMLRVDHFDSVYFVVRGEDGRTIFGDADFPPLREPRSYNEPSPYDGVMRDEPVRIIALKTVIGTEPVLIGAAETLRKRASIRYEIMLSLLALESVLALLVVATIWLAVARGLRPLKAIRERLIARAPDDLSAVPQDDVPLELRPVLEALNRLLERTQTGARAKQDFLANVAHQLRTPLAGLRTQLEWLQHKHADDSDTAHSSALMMSSIERMIRQTNQLLALARAEPSQFEKTGLQPVALHKLVEESVQHFVQEADKKSIDLGFDLQPTHVTGDRFLLRDMLDNLIDNAIRHSPPGTSVTVSCRQRPDGAGGTLLVEDGGPGIPHGDREKIFDRFYRLDDKVAGSGLGLAIVRDIANDHDAHIILGSGPDGKGTVFAVEIPLRQ
jgi:two-component system sensor histidine kinase TctE